jgi:hypothetical protein
MFGQYSESLLVQKSQPRQRDQVMTNLYDYSLTFVITDPSIPPEVDGLSINMFRSNSTDFPDIEVGSIIKLEAKVSQVYQIQTFGGRLQGRISRKETCEVLSGSSIMDNAHAEVFEFIQEWWDSLKAQNIKINLRQFKDMRPLLKVKNITTDGMYFDLACKVVCKLDPFPTHAVWGVTDFTSNPNLDMPNELLDNHKPNIQDPYLLLLTLWDENTQIDIPVNSYVLLRNAKSKFDSNGRLEIGLHGDPRFASRQSVRLLDSMSNEMKELYEAEQLYKSKEPDVDYAEKKMNAKDDDEEIVLSQHSNWSLMESALRKSEVAHVIDNITTIRDILANPRVPYKYCIKVKVIDHMPTKITHFVRPFCIHCNVSCLPGSSTTFQCPQCDDDKSLYFGYMFSLLVSDGTGYLPVIFNKGEAVFFVHIGRVSKVTCPRPK